MRACTYVCTHKTLCSSTHMYSCVIYLLHVCSAFARYPDGDVEHYYCAKENIAKEQIASPQPPVTEQEPSFKPSTGRDLYPDTNPF